MNASEKRDVCNRAVAEGFVLLEHDGMLPFGASDKVAVFGRAQFEYIKSGSGSGGLVVCPYVTSIGDELIERVNADPRAVKFYRDYISAHPYDSGDNWEIPQSQKEADLDESFVKTLASDNDKAIIVISRMCGECFDLKPEKGGYYLTDEEEREIELVSRCFEHTCVLLNVGNIIDMRWVKKYGVGTVAYVWQGGQDGGSGVAKTLVGEWTPSGRLPDTVAENLSDYPAHGHFGDRVKNIHTEDIYVGYRYFETFAKDKVLYPFGYGLSYTKFEYKEVKADRSGDKITIKVTVENTGAYCGRDVVQCYAQKPQGKLGKPARELVAFRKTRLLQPNESETVTLEIDANDLSSYDDGGASGFAYCYVLEKGEYGIFVGSDVRGAQKVFSFVISKTIAVERCRQAVAPKESFERLTTSDGLTPVYEAVPTAKYDMTERMNGELPKGLEITGNKGITLQDVASGKNTMDEFVAQFDASELCPLVRGEGMSSPKAPIDGTASSFGGVTEKLHDSGVPVMTTVDGPSGVRLTKKDGYATCIPTGTLLAAMWSPETVYEVYGIFAEELRDYKLDVALAPGMNIHRYVLGGRNFEYFSEDPLVTGLNATAVAKSFYDNGVRCTLKHFAVNSQECARGSENEVLSERALREIYLRGFEIAVKSGYVDYIMSSYNRINGLSAASEYDLLTTILRDEWGFDGVVMTDWWTKIDDTLNGTFGEHNLAAMVRAQNDVYMVTSDVVANSDDLTSALGSGELTVAQLQRSAKNIAKTAIDSLSFACFDKDQPLCGSVCDTPVAVFDGNKCRADVEKEGIYSIKLVYSCAGDGLVQNEVKVCFGGQERQSVLLKGTNGELGSHSVLLHLHPDAEIEFKGSVDISKIEIYPVKHRG